MNRFPQRRLARSAALVAVIGLMGACATQAQMKGNFDDADANHDGHVTLQEYKDYVTARLATATGRIARKFQQLSPADQAARLQKRFTKMDHGQKGYLDRKDWSGQ
jgi:Ca2+-binding EF-hand superfamily protein